MMTNQPRLARAARQRLAVAFAAGVSLGGGDVDGAASLALQDAVVLVSEVLDVTVGGDRMQAVLRRALGREAQGTVSAALRLSMQYDVCLSWEAAASLAAAALASPGTGRDAVALKQTLADIAARAERNGDLLLASLMTTA